MQKVPVFKPSSVEILENRNVFWIGFSLGTERCHPFLAKDTLSYPGLGRDEKGWHRYPLCSRKTWWALAPLYLPDRAGHDHIYYEGEVALHPVGEFAVHAGNDHELVAFHSFHCLCGEGFGGHELG